MEEKLIKAAEEYQAKVSENNIIDAFIAGAKWMINNPSSEALLYAANKSYQRGYKDAKFDIEMSLSYRHN